jgi:hypothetical protein
MHNNWAEVRMQMDQMLEMEREQARLRRRHTLRSTRWRRVVLALVLLFALTLIATTAQAATDLNRDALHGSHHLLEHGLTLKIEHLTRYVF